MLDLFFLLADFFDLSAQAQCLRKLEGEAQQQLMTQMCAPGGPFPWHAPHPPVIRLERFSQIDAKKLLIALQEKNAPRFLELYDALHAQVEGMIEEQSGNDRLRRFLERHQRHD